MRTSFTVAALSFLAAFALVITPLSAAPALYTGSFNSPSGAAITTAVPITAASGTNLVLNVFASAPQGVLVDYGNSATGLFAVYDGGETNYAALHGLSGLFFSQSSTNYAYNLATVAGPITANGVIRTNANVNNAAGLASQMGGFEGIASNATGGATETDIYTSGAGGITTAFWYNNGSTAVESASISNNGQYNAGGSTYGPSVASVTDHIIAGNYFQTGPAGYQMTNAAAGSTTNLGTGGGSVAGIAAQAYYVYTPAIGQFLAMDDAGNVGISGNYYAASERRLKDNIVPLERGDAGDVIDHTTIVRFCYKTEHCKPGEDRHIGFIADDTPLDIAPKHKSDDLVAEAAIDLQAIKDLRRGQVAESVSERAPRFA